MGPKSFGIGRMGRLVWLSAACALTAVVPGASAQAQSAAAPAVVSDETAQLELYNWGTPVDKQIWDDAIARFNQRYPNVTVTNNIVPVTSWADYADKLTTLAAGGQLPDLINIGDGYRAVTSRNLVIPLDDFLAASPELTADIDPKLLNSTAVDGHVYWVPHLYETMVIFYNTKMFEAAGIERPADDWTWDDFLAVATKLTTGEGADKVYGYCHAYANFQMHPWFLTNGSSQTTADLTASNLNDPKLAEGLQFAADLVNVHEVSPDVQGFNPNDSFAAEKCAMVGAGHYAMQTFDQAGFTEYDIVPWPRKTTGATVFSGAGWGISAGSEHPDLAWELIKEFSGPATQLDKAKAGVNEPVSKTALNSPEFLSHPEHASLFFEVIPAAEPAANPTFFNDLERVFMRHLDEVMAGDKTADQAMAEAHDELSALLEQ